MDINTENISSFIEQPALFLNSHFDVTSMSSLLSNTRKMISNMNEKLFQSIPLATNFEYPNKSLIRYRCIISDMLSPDFCYLKLPFMPNNEIEDPMELDFCSNVDDKNTLQRFKYCIVLIPGLNRWVLDSWKADKEFLTYQPTNSKRLLQDEDKVSKKQKPDSTYSKDQSENDYETIAHQTKMSKYINSTDELVKCCILYDYDVTNDFKMNEVIEVVGIIDFYQTSEIQQNETHDLQEAFEFTSDEDAYPHSIVPRLHALYVKKLNSINPITNLPDLDSFTKIRHEILVIFSKILFGDEVASEYLLSCLISRVYVRNELSSIGSFPINFIGLPKLSIEDHQEYIQKFYHFISLLLPSSHFYSLTVKGLNSESLVPKKDSSDEKMKKGRLQLADGTFLLIDECDLETGKLNDVGVQNVELLKSLVHFQKIKYDFQYYSIEINTNVIVIIISKGKSILGCMCPIKIKSTSEQSFQEVFNSLNDILNDNFLSLIRAYLYKVRLNEFSISDDLKTKIAEGFVQMRQDAKAKDQKMTVEDLHQMINLARLQSISYGYNELPNSLWLRTLYLEEERKKQLAT